ncbi:serine/threonine-protein kinase [Streptomyces sp. NPDC060194]|uniref:serine/threonine-protein kinase n=1 Tax=Streptomyces sp. NPDC060194 TaxID=3347069 RepID=UPI003667F022
MGELLDGRYALRRRLGAGAQGTVFAAYDTRLRREVAVKAAAARGGEALERFRRELRTLAALRHPHVVAVHDGGEQGGVPYAVLDLVEGESLAALLERTARLPVRRVLQVGAQLADGLAAAHERGIAHRDVKPGNVLIARDGTALLCDFGLANGWMPDAAPLTVPYRASHCTPGFASPEQATVGLAVGPPSDVFSLGATLYALLAGGSPFHAALPEESLALAREAVPRPVTDYRPDAPEAVAVLLAAMLAKAPADRPSARSVQLRLRTELDRLDAAVGRHRPYTPTEPADRPPDPRPGPARAAEDLPGAHGRWGEADALAAATDVGDGDRAGPPPAEELWRALEAAEALLRAGRPAAADDGFRTVTTRLDAAAEHHHPALYAAQLGRVRALHALGRTGAAAGRLARLRERVPARLGAQHPLAAAVGRLDLGARRLRPDDPAAPAGDGR